MPLKWIPCSKSGASKSRPLWAAHTRIGNVWEYPPGRPLTPPKGRENHCFVTDSRLVSGGNKKPAKQSGQDKAKEVGGGELWLVPLTFVSPPHILHT